MRLRTFALGMALAVLLPGCAARQGAPLEVYQPVRADLTTQAGKVDSFVVVLDTATTLEDRYQNRRHGQRAREIVSRLNRAVPALDTRASLVAFSAGSCLSCDDADVLYGPAPYNRADFEAALGRYDTGWKPGVPAGPGIDRHASELILRDSPGRVALIVVGDSENMMHGRAFKTVQKVRGKLGSRLCIYPILVDRNADGRVVTEYLVKVGGCGFTVNADDIETPDAMARYVREIFLGPAGAGPAASPVTAAVDSDGDGVPDGLDQCPNTPMAATVNADGCWAPPGVYFDTDQTAIKDPRALDQAAAVFKANPSLTAEVQGHTDSTASAAYNQTLSEARARAVRDYFTRQGIAPERIDATGFGETRPAAANDTPEGRARNRRVELQPHMR
ncbi:MAG: OmpA family protein [Desulfobacterales bacterium]|nr:OmpA family protein [Desulfobacterales bacterium]